MTDLSREDKISLSDIRFEKSREMLSDAEKNHKFGMYKTSVNRSYYSVLHASRSLLILKGIDPEHHKGALRMFSLHFIRDGLISEKMGRIFKNLLSVRTDVDYGDMETINDKDAEDALGQAKAFFTTAGKFREKLVLELKEGIPGRDPRRSR